MPTIPTSTTTPRFGRGRTVVAIAAAVAAAALTGCSSDGRTLAPPGPGQNASISTPTTQGGTSFDTVDSGSGRGPGALTAPWADGGTIDPRYTCDGGSERPLLRWPAPPPGTAEIAITVVDEDADDFVHWAATGIAASSVVLAGDARPAGLVESLNGSGGVGYAGPCPPPGDDSHRYRFTVHFLRELVTVTAGAPASEMVRAIRTATFDEISVFGLYRRT